MPLPENDTKIVIFSMSSAERDYLRSCINGIPATVLCFEKETIIFDNFNSILPEIVIARTDSWAIAWRFIFAMHALESQGALLIASDVIKSVQFDLAGHSTLIQILPATSNGVGINAAIRQLMHSPPSIKEMLYQPMLVGENRQIKEIRSMLPILRSSPDPVLIEGESGTGKELLARLIVNNRSSAFVKFNCAELMPEMIARLRISPNLNLLKSHSAADSPAQASTIHPWVFLLNKINLLHPQTQSEILLLLEWAEQSCINKIDAAQACIKFIATTEEDLSIMVQQGRFRKDLFYRLNVIPVHMPALRQRSEDISLLLDYFILEACAKTGKSFFVPTESTRASLCCYEWPGNLNELRNLMYRLAVSGDESFIFTRYSIPREIHANEGISMHLIDGGILPDSLEIKKYLPGAKNLSLKNICDTFVSRTEKKLIQKALNTTKWNRRKAASLLNISYKSMLNKMKAYDIE